MTREILFIAALSGWLLQPWPTVSRADWPEFRGAGGQGLTQATLPTLWAPEKNIVWRTELAGQGWSSPIVVQDRIYLTAAVPSDGGFSLSLLIVDAPSGQLTKAVKLFEQTESAPSIHSKNSHASSTPVFDGQRIYLHFGHQGTACCQLDGSILWLNGDLGYAPVHGNGGSPVVVGNRLIFTRDGGDVAQVTALDTQTGNMVWNIQRQTDAVRPFSFCTPTLIRADGADQLITPGSDVVQSLDPATGGELWRVRYSGFSVVPRPLYESGLVFVSTGFMEAKLMAIDPTGRGDVTDTHVKWSTKTGVPKTSSFVASNGQLIMVSDKGVISSLDALSGKELWKKRVGGDFSSSLLLAKQNLYAFDELGQCSVLDIAGSQPDVIATNHLNERTLSSPAVVANDLLIRTDKALYRIGQK